RHAHAEQGPAGAAGAADRIGAGARAGGRLRGRHHARRRGPRRGRPRDRLPVLRHQGPPAHRGRRRLGAPRDRRHRRAGDRRHPAGAADRAGGAARVRGGRGADADLGHHPGRDLRRLQRGRPAHRPVPLPAGPAVHGDRGPGARAGRRRDRPRARAARRAGQPGVAAAAGRRGRGDGPHGGPRWRCPPPPDVTTLLLFLPAALVLVAIPGPNHLYITARSIGEGRRAGLASAFGVETGTLVHIAAAAAGLSALVAASATAFGVLRYAGAAYLVYLAYRTLRGGDDGDGPALRPQPLRRVYLDGVLVNVLNPKVVLFF